MSEETTVGGTTYNLPSDRLRITATYRAGTVGDLIPDGQPESVEIIYNDPIGATPAEAAEFIATLISALTRAGGDVVTEVGEQTFTDGDDPISYPVTFQGFEDSTLGYSHKWFFGGPGWQALLTDMGIPEAA